PRAAQLQPRLEACERVRCAAQVDVPRESVERLELLNRIRLDTRANGLLHDAVQVDEHVAAQQLIHFTLARAVPTHQLLQRRRLVVVVMVDVQIRILRASLHYEVDEALEQCALRLAIECPPAGVCTVPAGEAEQVLEPVAERERVTLDVEEQIPFGGSGQRRKAVVRCDRLDQLVNFRAGAPALELYPCLCLDPIEAGPADAVELR